METLLTAIANPVRRQLLDLVWEQERTPSQLAERLELSRPATSQHLRVLRDAGLVRVRREAGHRLYSVDEERMRELRAFLEGFWGDRLGALKSAAEEGAP